MSTTVGSGSATMLGKEVSHLLAREIAKAIHATPGFLGGYVTEGFKLTVGNESLTGSVSLNVTKSEVTSSSIGSALSKEIYSFLKSDPSATALLKDAAKTGADLTLTRDIPKLGSAHTVTLSDATKITFQGLESMTKHIV